VIKGGVITENTVILRLDFTVRHPYIMVSYSRLFSRFFG